jgi:hypothetical protein
MFSQKKFAWVKHVCALESFGNGLINSRHSYDIGRTHENVLRFYFKNIL